MVALCHARWNRCLARGGVRNRGQGNALAHRRRALQDDAARPISAWRYDHVRHRRPGSGRHLTRQQRPHSRILGAPWRTGGSQSQRRHYRGGAQWMVRSIRRGRLHAALRLVPHGQSSRNEIHRKSPAAIPVIARPRHQPPFAARSRNALRLLSMASLGLVGSSGSFLKPPGFEHVSACFSRCAFGSGPGGVAAPFVLTASVLTGSLMDFSYRGCLANPAMIPSPSMLRYRPIPPGSVGPCRHDRILRHALEAQHPCRAPWQR